MEFFQEIFSDHATLEALRPLQLTGTVLSMVTIGDLEARGISYGRALLIVKRITNLCQVQKFAQPEGLLIFFSFPSTLKVNRCLVVSLVLEKRLKKPKTQRSDSSDFHELTEEDQSKLQSIWEDLFCTKVLTTRDLNEFRIHPDVEKIANANPSFGLKQYSTTKGKNHNGKKKKKKKNPKM